MAITIKRKTRLTRYQILLLQEALEQYGPGTVDETALLALRQVINGAALNSATNIIIER